MHSVAQPLWPFNYCDLAPQAQCGCIGLAVCPRNRQPGYGLRDFEGMPQMIMSTEDLQTFFRKKELPGHLSDWLIFADTDLSSENEDKTKFSDRLSDALRAPFRDHLARTLMDFHRRADTLPTENEKNLFKLALCYASQVPLDQLLPSHGMVSTCSYNYRGTPVIFAANGSEQWLIDSVCDDVEMYGTLLDTFTHATPGIQAMFNGGTLGPSDTRSFMPVCHVPNAGMLLHLYLVGVPMDGTVDTAMHTLATLLVNAIHTHLKSIIPVGETYGTMRDDKTRARLFNVQDCLQVAVDGKIDTYRESVMACIHALLLRPASSVAATYSHHPSPGLPHPCARKLLCLSTMASKQVRSSDAHALINGKKTNERQGVMVPHVFFTYAV